MAIEPKDYAGDIPVYCAFDEIVCVDDLVKNPKNPNTHPEQQIELLAKIIEKQGWRQPIKVSMRSGYIVSGHGRYEAALFMGAESVPVDYQPYSSEEEETADLLADNRIAELAEIDDKMLAEIFAELSMPENEIDITGYTASDLNDIIGKIDFDEEPESGIPEEESTSLTERFIVPPTSVLNARQGEWGDRKRAWISKGINSELGRDEKLTFSSTAIADPYFYEMKAEKEKELGRALTTKEFEENYYQPVGPDNSTSIFDPVLCEICYKWFSAAGAKILDPFAGGSVRGIVAALSDREYTGIDLRSEQIEANVEQWKKIKKTGSEKAPEWITGDSLQVLPTITGEYDFVFSCPPYADLEQYSDLKEDLSNMEYEDFLEAYSGIIKEAVGKLKQDRFAAFVVGEVRDKKGNYRNFVSDTIAAFRAAGMEYYNEIILVTPISGLRFRLGRQFDSGRKVGKTHQNVLVFVKGDAKKATQYCGEITVDMPDDFYDIEDIEITV